MLEFRFVSYALQVVSNMSTIAFRRAHYNSSHSYEQHTIKENSFTESALAYKLAILVLICSV